MLFGESELEALDDLQVAIDMYVEERVQECMMAEGFDYRPLSVVQIELSLGIGVDAETLRQMVADGEIAGDPNESILASLAEGEQQEWERTRGECLIRESIAHPLAESDTWYAGAERRASERTAADSRVVDAELRADECFRDEGYSDLESLLAQIDTAGQQIVFENVRGEISVETAEERLQELERQQRLLVEVQQRCDAERLTVERQVFSENLATIAQEEELLAVEWANSVQEVLLQFEKELAFLAES